MLEIHRSFSAADVADFQSLKGKGGHFERGLFIAEGPKVVGLMLDSELTIRAAYFTEEYLDRFREKLSERPETIQVFVAAKPEMEALVGYALHQGLMLSVEIPQPKPLELSELPKHWTAVALDSIADAENMGAIIRNCAAFGVTGIILDDQSCNPYLRRSVRVSMGTIADVTFYRVPDLAMALESLRDAGFGVIGAAIGQDAKPLHEAAKFDRTVLVFGSEGWGLRDGIRNACTELREIPMSNDVDSLNVAIASGIFLYEYTG